MAKSRIRQRGYDEANRRSNAMVRRARVPRVISNGNTTRVVGTEMVIPEIGIENSFEAYQLEINFMVNGANITLNGTWLARQALLFNKFKFARATLRYVPFCTTNTPGRVMLAWNGDTEDTNPTNARQVSQYQNSVESPAWREVSSNMQISRLPEYVVGDYTGTEAGTPTPGAFVFATDNGPTTRTSAGSLYLDYDVTFWSRASFANNT